MRQPYFYLLWVPISLRTGIKGNGKAFKVGSEFVSPLCPQDNVTSKEAFLTRNYYLTTSYKPPFALLRDLFVRNDSYRGAGISWLGSFIIRDIRSNTSLIFGKHPKVISHQPHIAFKKKKGSYRESLPDFNFLSYLISTANIQLLYAIIAIFDVKSC